jgi:hypothetical protein
MDYLDNPERRSPGRPSDDTSAKNDGFWTASTAVTVPAWNDEPSWYLVATDDRMVPPDAQRAISKRAGSTVVERERSHAIYVSQPGGVAELTETATDTVKAAGR